MSGHVEDLQFQHAVARLHGLGPRATYELLIEVGAAFLIRTLIEETVARYVKRLNHELLAATGGDRFPPAPLHPVGGDQ